MTSLTILLALFALLIFGGHVLRGFTAAMILGVFVGTYSSIYVSSSLLITLGLRAEPVAERDKPVKAGDRRRRAGRTRRTPDADGPRPRRRAGRRRAVAPRGFASTTMSIARWRSRRVRADGWSPPPLDALDEAALAPLLALDPPPEFLLLGTGPTLVRPPVALVRALEARGIGVEAMDSRAAARAWGMLRGEGRWIAGAFYPLDRGLDRARAGPDKLCAESVLRGRASMKYLLTIGALLAAIPAAAQTTPPAPMPRRAPPRCPPAASPHFAPIPAPDYNTDAGWLCRPGRQDACAVDQNVTVIPANGKAKIVKFKADAGAARIDCFYVYPTVSLDPTPNSDLNIGPEEKPGRGIAGGALRRQMPRVRAALSPGHADRAARPDGGQGQRRRPQARLSRRRGGVVRLSEARQ